MPGTDRYSVSTWRGVDVALKVAMEADGVEWRWRRATGRVQQRKPQTQRKAAI